MGDERVTDGRTEPRGLAEDPPHGVRPHGARPDGDRRGNCASPCLVLSEQPENEDNCADYNENRAEATRGNCSG